MNLCEMEQNKINCIKDLMRFLKENRHILLFGAGYVGKLILDTARDINLDKNIDGFLVSDKKYISEYLDKNITVISEYEIKGACVLVTTKENLHDEIIRLLFGANATKVIVVSNELIDELSIIKKYWANGPQQTIENDAFIKSIPLTQLQFSVHLCEHCNLNCAGCNHFSPLAKEEFTDIVQYEKDMERLGDLADGDAYRIELMGGEPLLNKDAILYAEIARKYFPKARISFLSNGILVKSQSEEFFEKCRENRINIDLTPYPINVDYEDIFDFIDGKGLTEGRFQTGSNVKIWTKEVFDLNPNGPKSPAVENWTNCIEANNCMHLRNGKMSCTKLYTARHFVEYFKTECKNMYFSQRDFIDIYDVKSIQDIFDFFAKPLPFCKYCKTKERHAVEWKHSEKNIFEWT